MASKDNLPWIRREVPVSLILEYRNVGLDLDEHKLLIQIRVPAELIQKYANAGLKVNDHELSPLQPLEPAEAIKAKK